MLEKVLCLALAHYVFVVCEMRCLVMLVMMMMMVVVVKAVRMMAMRMRMTS